MDFLIGFVIAIGIAVTGVGAGIVTAPLLILFLHVPIEVAVSTALAYSAIVKLIVAPVEILRKRVCYRVLGIMLLGGLPGVIIGSLLFGRVAQHGPRSLLYAFLGAIIAFSSVWHIYRYFSPAPLATSATAAESAPRRSRRRRWLAAIMLPIGAEVGFSSSGAGALGTIALLTLTPLTAAQVVGTDLTFGLGITAVGAGIHVVSGAYNVSLLWKLAVGGVFGAALGTSIRSRIPNRQLRLALSVWLLSMGLEFCYQAVRAGSQFAFLGSVRATLFH